MASATTESENNHKLLRFRSGRLALFCMVLGCTGLSMGGDVSFNPELSLEAEYGDNVIVSSDNEAISDISSRVRVVLPVVNTWDTGSLLFSYAPSIERYRDVDQLDNDAHDLIFSVDDTPSRQSVFHLELGFTRSLDQGLSASSLGDELFLTPPSERDRLSGEISYGRQVGRRWGWNGTLDAADLTYNEIEAAGIPGATIEDRTEYGATAGLDFILSPQSTLGVQLHHRSNDLEFSGSEDLQQLSFVWGRTLGRGSDINLELGISDRSGEFLLVGQLMPEPVSDTEVFGGLEWTRTMRKARLQLLASRRPSAGGASRSTSTDSLVSIGLSGVPARSWNWTVAARYASRDPLDSGLEVTDSVGAGAQIEWRPTEFTGYRVGVDFVNQSSGAGAADRSLGRAWVGFVWYPRGPEVPTLEEEEE